MNKRANERELSAKQFEQLKTGYVNTIVDSMSNKDLYEYVANDMAEFVNTLTEYDLIEEIKYTKLIDSLSSKLGQIARSI